MRKMIRRWKAIIEGNDPTLSSILKNGALCVECTGCAVYEHFTLRSCYRCKGFHHLGIKCDRQQICLYVLNVFI